MRSGILSINFPTAVAGSFFVFVLLIPFIGLATSASSQQAMDDFWSEVEPPITMAIVVSPSESTSGSVYERIAQLDWISVVSANGLGRSFTESDALFFLVPSWDYLASIEGFQLIAPPESIYSQAQRTSDFISYRFELDDGRQRGVGIYIVEEDFDVDCVANVIYATILSGFATPAVTYSACQ